MDMFALFRRTKTLLSMHAAFCPKYVGQAVGHHILTINRSPIDYDIAGYFEPYVLQWLLNTDLQTAQWVHTVGFCTPMGPLVNRQLYSA